MILDSIELIDIPEKTTVIEINLGVLGYGFILCGSDKSGNDLISWFDKVSKGEKNPTNGKHFFLTWEQISQSLYFVYTHSSTDNKGILNGQHKIQVSISAVLSKRFGLAYNDRYSTYRLQGKDSKNYKIVLAFEDLYNTLLKCLRKRKNLKIVDSLKSFDKCVGDCPFYRGHSDYTFRLLPSLLRGVYETKERNMFQEFLETCPVDTISGKTDYEVLSLMQHYGLPTRLLDITTDKYVALFMACTTVFGQTSDINKIGAVLSFDYSNVIINEDEIQDQLSSIIRDNKMTEEPSDILKRSCFIQYKELNDNPRLKKQKGSFIVFGSDADSEISYETVYIVNKRSILAELNDMDYNEKTLLPELEHICHYIKQKYSK